MKILKTTLFAVFFASAVAAVRPAIADMPGTVSQVVNLFQNGKVTGGKPVTVDAKDSIKISDDVELPGFAFQVYDIDFTESSLTMKLIAKLEKLQITLYDNTTFDRYYYAFEKEFSSAEIFDATDV